MKVPDSPADGLKTGTFFQNAKFEKNTGFLNHFVGK
jgi:hypothetical protein